MNLYDYPYQYIMLYIMSDTESACLINNNILYCTYIHDDLDQI